MIMNFLVLFVVSLCGTSSTSTTSSVHWMRRYELAKRYSEIAVELSNHTVSADSYSAGTTTRLGRENERIRLAMNKLLNPSTSSSNPLSIVVIGGSITSGRMLEDYCKDCIPEIKYKHVWSGFLGRALEKASKSIDTPSSSYHSSTSSSYSSSSTSPSSFSYNPPTIVTHGINGASICAFARHASVHVARWLIEAKADVLLIELNVNDALPIRSFGTHKCLEGLMRSAHEVHHEYIAGSNDSPSSSSSKRELSIILVDIPKIVDSTKKSLINSVNEFDRFNKTFCVGKRTYASPTSDKVGELGSEKVIGVPSFEYAPTSRHVVMGAEFAHVQVSSCYNDAEVSLAHSLASALVKGTLGYERTPSAPMQHGMYVIPSGGVGGSACDRVTVGVTKAHNIKAAAALLRDGSVSQERRRLRMTNGASASDPFAIAACDGVHLTVGGQKLVAGLILQLFSDALLYPYTLTEPPPVNLGEAEIEDHLTEFQSTQGGNTVIPESKVTSTPPLFASVSDLIEFKPLILLEGSHLVDAVSSASCGVPGVTALARHVSDSKALVPLQAPICKDQFGFDQRGRLDRDFIQAFLSSQRKVDESEVSHRAVGGWSACVGVRKSILQEESRRCTHPGLYFFDQPLGQSLSLKVIVPSIYCEDDPQNASFTVQQHHHHHHHKSYLQSKSEEVHSKKYRISMSLLVSYENFGDVYVQLKFPDGSIFPPSTSEPSESSSRNISFASYLKAENEIVQSDGCSWILLSGWHRLKISVPQPHPIAALFHSLPNYFEVIIKAPNMGEFNDKQAGKEPLRWSHETSPLSMSEPSSSSSSGEDMNSVGSIPVTVPPIKDMNTARITVTSVFVSPSI